MSSSKDYTLTANDTEMVTKYRQWLQDYFKSDFAYETTLFMHLNKVKEFIMNEQSALAAGRQGSGQVQYPREYDLIVKVEKIGTSSSEDVL